MNKKRTFCRIWFLNHGKVLSHARIREKEKRAGERTHQKDGMGVQVNAQLDTVDYFLSCPFGDAKISNKCSDRDSKEPMREGKKMAVWGLEKNHVPHTHCCSLSEYIAPSFLLLVADTLHFASLA